MMKKRNIKFFVLLFLVVSISCIHVIAHASEDDPTLKLTLAGNESVKSLCADQEGGFYLLTSKCIYHWNDKEGSSADSFEVTQEVEGLAGIISNRNALYAITDQYEILQWSSDQWKSLGQSSLHKGDSPLFRCHMVAGEDMLFYSYKDPNDKISLYSFDITSGTFQQLSAFPAVWFCYRVKDGMLLSLAQDEKSGAWSILSYDYHTNKSQPPLQVGDISDSILGQSYDPQTDTFYLGMRNAIMTFSQENAVKKFTDSRPASILTALGNGRVAIVSNQAVRVYSQASAAADQITVLGFETMYSSDFTQKTRIAVDIRELQSESVMEAIARLLSSRDDTVDIFGFWTEEGLGLIKGKEFFTDLSISDSLSAALGELYPKIAEHMLADGDRLAAWPVRIQPELRMEEAELMAQYHITSPDTFGDLLDIIPQIQRSDLLSEQRYVLFDTISYNRKDLFSYFVQQYMLSEQQKGAMIDFSSAEFRAIAERILSETPVEDPYPRIDGTESALFELGSISNILNQDQKLPLKITASDPASIFTSVKVLVVNPYSRHKPQAIKYLEYLASKRTVEDYALYATMTEPLYDKGLQKQYTSIMEQLAGEQQKTVVPEKEKEHEEQLKNLEQQAAFLEQAQLKISAQAIENYQEFVKYFTILEDSLILYNERLDNLAARVALQDISLDDFVTQANQYIQMVYAEK